ncbi:hypothetical protein [Ruania zhangjianzhongii]|uniref:hypothetical protein n=1 Tax=Ruania zhangjianzhongii TaxID=2603206 RepID=UPI0011CC82D5|nr:hypothetical protein [Ruania zhangjianzhongii]
MGITQKTRRTLTALGAAGALTAGVLAGAMPATAAPSSTDTIGPILVEAPDSTAALAAPDGGVRPTGNIHHCSGAWCFQSIWDEAANDAGGWWAQSIMYDESVPSDRYQVSFWPRGETLHVMDRRSDGQPARAEVRVENRSGVTVDRDTFYTTYDSTFNLGTPDGSGNIPEGYRVYIRVCIGDSDRCSVWTQGIA